MSYNLRYYFTFYSDRDKRTPNTVDSYECKIFEKDYTGYPEEIEAQESPIIIDYNNSSDNKMQPLRGSELTLNLIATENFQLEDLYTEDEQKYLVYVRRMPGKITVNWELDEDTSGVDANLEILVNGIQVVNEFNNSIGSFTINRGDELTVKSFSYISSTGITGVNLYITGIATQRSVTFPFSIDTIFTPDYDIDIFLESTYSATEYTAIRSNIFYNSMTGWPIVFTKTYTSLISQSDAQNLSDTDSTFNTEGQAYAETNAIYPNIWSGFIIPDGCQESFAFTPYTIQVNAVDGLGLIKNLSYVQNDGNFWLGKQSFLDVIYNCLNRLAYPEIKINTCVNIYPESYTPSDSLDPLAENYVDAQRFLKDDEINPMNCQEVLESVLKEWTACIILSEGEWFIYRPNEAALSDTLVFRSYTDNVYTGTVSKSIKKLLGGYSQGTIIAPYFHALADQLKMIEKPYKNVSMSYKYGVKQNPDEELDNPNLSGAGQGCGGDPIGPCDDVTIPGYTKTGTMYTGLYPTGGVIFYSDGGTYPTLTNYYENDNLVPVTFSPTVQNYVKFVIEYENPAYINGTDMNFVISLTDGSTVWYLQADGSWAITPIEPGINYYTIRSQAGTTGTATITSNTVPSSGNITFRILAPSGTVEDIVYTSISAKVYINMGVQVGEIHTATQTGNYTFVPDTINVFNGDSDSSVYLGAIFLNDETTLTTKWKRRGLSESFLAEPYEATKDFLRIAVEELQRMYALPYVKFEGSIFNYFNPLTLFTIDLITGRFMPVSLRYDLQQNICKAVLTRVSNEEIAMDYTLEPDYGETTKVTVI